MFSPHAAVTMSSVVFSHYRHVQKEQQRHPVAQVLHEAQDVTLGLTGRDAFSPAWFLLNKYTPVS